MYRAVLLPVLLGHLFMDRCWFGHRLLVKDRYVWYRQCMAVGGYPSDLSCSQEHLPFTNLPADTLLSALWRFSASSCPFGVCMVFR